MVIKCFPLGAMYTNCYLAYDETTKEAYFFDCGGKNIERLNLFIKENNLLLKYIVLTHGHGDHIEGLNLFAKTYPEAKIYVGVEEKEFLYNSDLSLSSRIFGEDFIFEGQAIAVKEGDMIGEFKTIDTPGHTIGSKCFYYEAENILISGDTMFRRSYGRYDLPTGNINSLYESLEKLSKLPEKTVVYSAHSEPTTIAEEKIFLRNIGVLF
ncbi:MBL fold metallo-hydrolase [Fusobacterium gastrosuis]|uniref:MBL fold metallo-hydrolase n=1 Tax=Fusobacterium gastrosuis TaxID=1755100 RepID=UPI002A96ACCA|nr:MBL fold metallo-hydrolase [Fusobacterium gastrosuis]